MSVLGLKIALRALQSRRLALEEVTGLYAPFDPAISAELDRLHVQETTLVEALLAAITETRAA